MKAMLKKDIALFQAYLPQYIVVLMMVGLSAWLWENAASMVAGILLIWGMAFSNSLFTADEAAGWYGLAATLPPSRKGMVKARFTCGVGLTLASLLLSMGIGTLIWALRGGELLVVLFTNLLLAAVILIAMGCVFPVCYKLGAEKARFITYGFYLLAFGALFLLLFLGSRLVANEMALLWLTILGLFVCAAVALLVGYRLSVRFFENKEL